MTYKHIPQPYVVEWSWDQSRHEELTAWCCENIEGYFHVICLSGNSTLSSTIAYVTLGSEDAGSETEWVFSQKTHAFCLFMFECPRDALLFKLTWGGNNGS